MTIKLNFIIVLFFLTGTLIAEDATFPLKNTTDESAPAASPSPAVLTANGEAEIIEPADFVNLHIYVRSDAVTGSVDNKKSALSNAFKALDRKIESLKQKVKANFASRLKINFEKEGIPEIKMCSEVYTAIKHNQDFPINEADDGYEVTVTCTSQRPSIVFHYVALQRVILIAENQYLSELIKTVKWNGGSLTPIEVKFENTMTNSEIFPDKELLVPRDWVKRAVSFGTQIDPTRAVYSLVKAKDSITAEKIMELEKDFKEPIQIKEAETPEPGVTYSFSKENQVMYENEAMNKAIENAKQKLEGKIKDIKATPEISKSFFLLPVKDFSGMITIKCSVFLSY